MHTPDKQQSRAIHRMYVLRLWRDGPESPWRATVKAADDGKELHFASLENLYVYLQSETMVADGDPTRQGD